MTDDKLAIEEARRAAKYEALKSSVDADVANEVAGESKTVPVHDDEINAVSRQMRESAVDDVVETHAEVERGRVAARVSQVVDYIFFLIYGLLGIRLLLELFAAREGVAFFRFIKAVTDPVYWPFRGLVPSPSTPDGFSLDLSIIVALFVYALLHMAINGIFRIVAHRKVAV
jgi:uncharacterized protein YggT (Ycf19 family)